MENNLKKNIADYSQGKIYKIVCNKTGLVYIGSTYRSLEQRLKEHIQYYKAYIEKRAKYMISSTYVIVGNDYKIELIENVPCKNKKELEKREFYFIANMDCVNTYKPGSRTKRNNEYIEHMLKLLVDKCGKDIIVNILFRYGIDEYINNKKK